MCHEWNGQYIIHSEIYDGKFSFENLKTAKERSKAIDAAFRQKGVKELYTWAETDEQKRYNLFLGYKPTGKVMNNTFVDKNYPFEVHEYKKDLN